MLDWKSNKKEEKKQLSKREIKRIGSWKEIIQAQKSD